MKKIKALSARFFSLDFWADYACFWLPAVPAGIVLLALITGIK